MPPIGTFGDHLISAILDAVNDELECIVYIMGAFIWYRYFVYAGHDLRNTLFTKSLWGWLLGSILIYVNHSRTYW